MSKAVAIDEIASRDPEVFLELMFDLIINGPAHKSLLENPALNASSASISFADRWEFAMNGLAKSS